jgi:hypothetical protein
MPFAACRTRSIERVLNRHFGPQQVLADICATALQRHGPAPQDLELVGQAIGKVEILFDQNDGDVALGFAVFDHPPDLLKDIGLNALGRFIQQQDTGLHDHGAGNRQLLLLAALKIFPPPARHIVQHGEKVIDFIGDFVGRFGQDGEASFQIFLHRQ